MTYPLFNILYYIISAIILFFCAWRLQSYCKKSTSKLPRYFRNMALAAGMSSLFDALVFIFFIDNSFLLGIGTIIGGMFVLIAHVYGVAIFFHLTFPDISSKKIIIVGLVLVILIAISHIKFLPYPKIDPKGIVRFNFPLFSMIVFVLFSTAGLFPLSVAFAREAIKKKYLRVRSGFVAFGFLFLVIANILQSIAGVRLYVLAYLVLPTIAYVMTFIAVISRVKASSV